jgi:hypothetical protein
MADIDLRPTQQMADNAARGLELRKKHGRGGTAVGVARARDISNRKNLSASTVKRMHSFFSRHEGNQAGGEDDAGYIAWLLWGGDAGKSWSKRKVDQVDGKSENSMNNSTQEIIDRYNELKSQPKARVFDLWKSKIQRGRVSIGVQKISDWDKGSLISDIIRAEFGDRAVDAAFGFSRPGTKAINANVDFKPSHEEMYEYTTGNKPRGRGSWIFVAPDGSLVYAPHGLTYSQAKAWLKKNATISGQYKVATQRPGTAAKFSRPARFSRWEDRKQSGWGDLSRSYHATINGTDWEIVVDASTGKGTLMRATASGPKVVREGTVDELKRYAETAKASRPGAKAKFGFGDGFVVEGYVGNTIRGRQPARTMEGAEHYAKVMLASIKSGKTNGQPVRVEIQKVKAYEPQGVIKTLHARTGAKAEFDRRVELDKWTSPKGTRYTAGFHVEGGGTSFAPFVSATYLDGSEQLMSGNSPSFRSENGARKWLAKFMERMYSRTGTFLRPGAKATHAASENVTYSVAVHIGNQPAGERSARSLDEAKAYAKAMLQAAKANANGKPVVVDVFPVVNYSPKSAVLTLKASRTGAKKRNDLTEACWEGYEAVGTKKKDGKTVPNCVPKKAKP